MDWRSLTGIVVGIGAIALGQGADGGQLAVLLQPSGLAVVLGGCTGALLLQCGPARLLHALRLLRESFGLPRSEPADVRVLLRQCSATARRAGLLALDGAERQTNDPLLARGLRLLVDGITPSHLAEVLDSDIEAFAMQRRHVIRVWESAGGTAPTMGILGAVLGLVQVMQHLSDPSRLGSGIAVAFVSTLYGVGFANLIFLPIANRLHEQLAEELARRDQIVAALVAIAAGQPGHLIEERLPPAPDSAAKSTARAARPPRAASRSGLPPELRIDQRVEPQADPQADPISQRREPAIAPPF